VCYNHPVSHDARWENEVSLTASPPCGHSSIPSHGRVPLGILPDRSRVGTNKDFPNDTPWETLSHRLRRPISAPLLTAVQGTRRVPVPLWRWTEHPRVTCTTSDAGRGTRGLPSPLLTLNRAPAGYLLHSWHWTGHLRVTCSTPDMETTNKKKKGASILNWKYC